MHFMSGDSVVLFTWQWLCVSMGVICGAMSSDLACYYEHDEVTIAFKSAYMHVYVRT